MEHRCALCRTVFESTVQRQYVSLQYDQVAHATGHRPETRHFCAKCVPTLTSVTDHWDTAAATTEACAFCEATDLAEYTKLSTSFVTRANGGTSADMPVYTLCGECDTVFETFIESEQAPLPEPESDADIDGEPSIRTDV